MFSRGNLIAGTNNQRPVGKSSLTETTCGTRSKELAGSHCFDVVLFAFEIIVPREHAARWSA